MIKYDALIVGDLVSCDYIMAEHLSRRGLSVIAVRQTGNKTDMHVPESYFRAFPKEGRVFVKNEFEFLTYARQSRLIVSLTGTLLFRLRLLWPFRRFLGLPPVIHIMTGSDMSELVAEKSLKGYLYRQYLRFVNVVWCLPLPHALRNAVRLRLKNLVFMKGFPFIVPEDGSIAPVAKRSSNEPLRLFHCSNHDWNYTDFGANRNSIKGNDKFLRAFIRAVKEGCNFQLTLLDRGPDRQVARQMLEKAGVTDRVIWKDHLSRDELYAEIEKCHLVVNMFAHGGAGGISFETLGLGRPVMQYANPTYFNLMYGTTDLPFIVCHNEDEILERLRWCDKQTDFSTLAEKGKQWVKQYIEPDNALMGFMFYYTLLTGDERFFDYGPHIEECEKHAARVLAGNYDPFAGLS